MNDDGEVWFSGVDVCEVLGYAMPSNVIKDNLDEDERKLTNLTDWSGQLRKTWTINESGLYQLILSSTKPEAKAFKRWVTHEVLPSIRKAGLYATEPLQKREAELQVLTKLENDIESRLNETKSRVKDLKYELDETRGKIRELLRQNPYQLKLEFEPGKEASNE